MKHTELGRLVLLLLWQAQSRPSHAFASSSSATTNGDDCGAYRPTLLRDPCNITAMNRRAPDRFSLHIGSNYGRLEAACLRARAPVWADRVFNLALNGYYDNNYMFRVITGKYVQFGTAGDPTISNLYNYTSAEVALTATVGMVGAVATVAVIAAVVMAAIAVVTLVAVAATAKCTSIRRARVVCQGSPTRSGHCP